MSSKNPTLGIAFIAISILAVSQIALGADAPSVQGNKWPDSYSADFHSICMATKKRDTPLPAQSAYCDCKLDTVRKTVLFDEMQLFDLAWSAKGERGLDNEEKVILDKIRNTSDYCWIKVKRAEKLLGGDKIVKNAPSVQTETYPDAIVANMHAGCMGKKPKDVPFQAFSASCDCIDDTVQKTLSTDDYMLFSSALDAKGEDAFDDEEKAIRDKMMTVVEYCVQKVKRKTGSEGDKK